MDGIEIKKKMKKRISNPIVANATGKVIATGTTANKPKKFPDLGTYEWNNPARTISTKGGSYPMAARSILLHYGTEIGHELANMPTDVADYLMGYDLNKAGNETILTKAKTYFYGYPFDYISKKIIKAAEKKDNMKHLPNSIEKAEVTDIMGKAIASRKFKDKVDEVADAVYKYQTDNYIPPLVQQSTRDAAESQGSTSGSGGDKKDNDAGSGDPNSGKKSDNTTLMIVIGAAILVGIVMLKKSR